MQIGLVRHFFFFFFLNQGQGPESEQEKIRCLRVRRRHQFYWKETSSQELQTGLDSPGQGKIVSAKGKQETKLTRKSGELRWEPLI